MILKIGSQKFTHPLKGKTGRFIIINIFNSLRFFWLLRANVLEKIPVAFNTFFNIKKLLRVMT